MGLMMGLGLEVHLPYKHIQTYYNLIYQILPRAKLVTVLTALNLTVFANE